MDLNGVTQPGWLEASPRPAAPPPWPAHIIGPAEEARFRESYNRMPFGFSHNLGGHALFEAAPLVELSEFLERGDAPDRVVLYTDDAELNQGWKRSARPGARVRDCLANIQHSHSWVLLKDIQKHPHYRALLDRFLTDLEQALNLRIRPSITWVDAYLFVSSPGMVTPYHIDHETNFLLQIRGQKTVNLFDPSDRTVLSDEEIERYYTGDPSSARFREELQRKAMVFELVPGRAVHQPPLAPHWVRTGDDWSVSLSLLFFLREYDAVAKVYQVNHYLRRFGMRPAPPGRSVMKDRLKKVAMSDLGYRARRKTDVVRFGLSKFTSPLSFTAKLARQMFAR